MTLTPLHRALGLTDGDLTLGLVRQACTAAVRERDELDWKATLPLTLPTGKETGRDAQQDELAKDIAAMANSRGGLIVYGVSETRGTSAASHITSVGPPDETTLQNIRRVASNLIHPPVTGLNLRWLTDNTGDIVLTLDVAPSVESPHLIRPRNQPSGSGFWFAVPYRNGPDTEWMPERMIESAYRDRLASRRQRDQDLHQLHAELASATAQVGNSWVVAVAQPETRPSPRRLDQAAATLIFERAWYSPWRNFFNAEVATEYLLTEAQTRRGLRRFRQRNTYTKQVAPPNINAYVRAIAEVHYDGSVGIALSRGGLLNREEFPDGRFLCSRDLDQALLNLFTLARQTARDLPVNGDYSVMLSVESATGILFRHITADGQLREFDESDRIPPFQPVLGTFLLSEGFEAAVHSLAGVAEDAVNQTGALSLLDPQRLMSAAARR